MGDVFCLLTLQQAIRTKYDKFELYTDPSVCNILGDFIEEYGLVDSLYGWRPESADSSRFGFGADNLCSIIEAYNGTKNTAIQLIAYPFSEGYPFKSVMRFHLKQYMERELKIENKGCLFLQSKPIPQNNDKYITIQTKTGWSRYKEWSMENWQNLIKLIKNNTTLKIHQIGAANDPVPEGVDKKSSGDFSDCLNEQCWAEAHVGLDSLFNHTSDVIWSHKGGKTPAVILFGSTCPTGFGYEENENISLDLSCQPCYKENVEIVNAANRSLCYNNHKCMKEISPEMVFERLEIILNE